EQNKAAKATASYQQAVAAYQQALQVKPNNADAHYYLGVTYLALGRKQDAQQVYKTLLTLDQKKAQELFTEINKPANSPSSNGSGNTSPQSSVNVPNPPPAAVPANAAQERAALQAKAEQGDTAAQKKLGEYYFGKGDNPNGLKWLQKSAEGGNADAQSSLGWRYERGNGVPENVEEARKWYRMASEQGHGTAQANLCSCYVEPLNISDAKDADPNEPIGTIKGTKADMQEAIKWCGASAKRGGIVSQYRLGLLYAKGSADVKPDYEEAYFWLSVTGGHEVFRAKVAKQLTAEKRAEIEKNAKNWKPGSPTPPYVP
ncbi:MAG: tetratricopeptide repeat protein, partial [Bacteroidota bacterium]|nr:tetratricopeptide repeat protein [Bacteroidota bacterium]